MLFYITHKKMFMEMFPETAEMYQATVEQYNEGDCQKCTKKRVFNFLARLVFSGMKNKYDDKKIRNTLTDEEYEYLINYRPKDFASDCRECVIKHLSSAFVLINEVQNGHAENETHLHSQLNEALREGWGKNGTPIRFKMMPLNELREMIIKEINIDVSEIRFLGYLALAEEITANAKYKSTLRKMRRDMQNEIERNKKK